MRLARHALYAAALLVLASPPATCRADQPRPFGGPFRFVIAEVEPLGDGDVLIRGLLLDGHAQSLGRFAGAVEYLVHPDGSFEGTAIKVASNGDELREVLAGSLTGTGSLGTFAVTGGTGRFARAAGGGTFASAWTSPMTADVHFRGSIRFNASDRRR